ncbi:hypothetical protein SEA_SUPERCHUNK_45 [Mycobacterium phage Superchunk]|nr:hypothetical protein SEA_SUPERCHUNK_45 [Mycobacterium phage Superchunk]
MKIKDVERFTIPLGNPEFGGEGTTVEELIKGLKKLPAKAVVTVDYGGGNLFATHTKPDIDPDCPQWIHDDVWKELIEQNNKDIRRMAASAYIPTQYMR